MFKIVYVCEDELVQLAPKRGQPLHIRNMCIVGLMQNNVNM